MNKRNIATSPCGGAITREKKEPIRNKMFVKEHIVCRSVSGQVSTQHRTHHLQSCVPARGPLTTATCGPLY